MDRDLTPAAPDRRRWLGLAMLSLGVAMIIVDATIVNVAIPSIIRTLNINLADAEWINSIYALVFAALLITLGRVGDLMGRKRLFLSGLAVFVASSVFAGLAPTGGLLILARFLQGTGGAMILPSTLSTVNATFRGRERAIAFGIWGSVIGGMAAFGPLLGGWLTTDYSWRWAFFINVPIGLLAIVGGAVWVRESRDVNARRGFDALGFVLVTAGLTALVFALIEGQRYGWWRPEQPFGVAGWAWPLAGLSIIPFAIALAALGLASFLLVEWRRLRAGRVVLADLRLFRLRSYRYGNLAATIVSLGEFGMVFVLPLFLQATLGYSAFRTGLLLMALAAGAFIGGPSAAALAHRFGARRVVTAGMALEAVAIGSLALLLGPSIGGLRLVPSLFVYGVGVGLATAQLTSVILVEVPPAESGQASGMQSTFRQVGSALGIAILGTVLAVSLGTQTDRLLARDVPALPAPQRAAVTRAVKSSAGQVITELRAQPGNEAVVAAASEALTEAARRAAEVAAGFVVLGFIASWLLPETGVPAEAPDDLEAERRRARQTAPVDD
ncbi:MAG TPA: MFS transporter [Thermomicrobiaceae bacterium]|nr:MFS transporter [Thermomicrobiaceae bacterium]